MESKAPENWRTENTSIHQRKTDSPKESWVNDRPNSSNGRRMSDGAPAPFNRTRSFKTKQLVRSQAIRESQSPPRVPSPRPSGKVDSTERNKNSSSVKKKSLSVDSDDRCSMSEDFKIDLSEKKPIILKKLDVQKPNDVSSILTPQNIAIDENTNTPLKLLTHSEVETKVLEEAKDLNMVKVLSSAVNNNGQKRNNNALDKRKTNVMDTGTQSKEHCDLPNPNLKQDFARSKNTYDNSSTVITNMNTNTEAQITIGRSTTTSYTHKANNNNGSKVEGDGKKPNKISLAETKKQSSFNKSQEIDDGSVSKKVINSLQRGNGTRVEFQQVEIQVTSGDYDTTCTTNPHDSDTYSYSMKGNRRCDCMSLDEDEEKEKNTEIDDWKSRRATCPSKQDSGICCWEQCQCCSDLSPDSNDADDDLTRNRRQKHNFDHDVHHQSIDNCRCQDRWLPRKSGSTLTVQRANSGGNPRLLRKQSSGGSIDSGQHSIASPFLSRDNSTELMISNYEPIDLNRFVKETLNKSYKDRINLLKIEHELISLVKDNHRQEHRFSQSSSYGRLLIHRCAELFGMKHGVDASKQYVYVAKPPSGSLSCRIPPICPFQQWCVEKFLSSPTTFCEDPQPPAKSILKRDAHSLDDEGAALQAAKPSSRSKSFEQREEEYSKARERIFKTSEQEGQWEWDERRGNETDSEHGRPQILLPEGDRTSRASRLTKVHSLETQESTRVVRGVVSKAHSFGGYGDRPNITRQDSAISTHSAPPTRILSQKGELASSNWRLSPGNSSGYRTLSGRSDSITPSPTPNGGDSVPVSGGVLWAITDISSVPAGALIIHPQTGQPLTNSDGSMYYYDPAHPLPQNLINFNQLTAEGVRVLKNPERRRSRLEKQRATLSPGNETELSNEKTKSIEDIQESINDSSTNESTMKTNINTNGNEQYSTNEGENSNPPCLCCECEERNTTKAAEERFTNVQESNGANNQYDTKQIIENNQETIKLDAEQNVSPHISEPIPQASEISPGASKILEQVVAAEFYVPSENCIYGSGYENVPDITADPNLLEHSMQLENATGLQASMNKDLKPPFSEDNMTMVDNRQENGYGVICGTYPHVEPSQEYYDGSVHQEGPYPNATHYDGHNPEISGYPGCCGPVIFRGPPPSGVLFQPQPQPYTLPISYIPAQTSAAILQPHGVAHHPQAPPPPPPQQPQPHMYQGWGWPTIMYTPPTTLPHTALGELPKVAPPGTFHITQTNDINIPSNTNVNQPYYPHGQSAATVLMAQPPPCFPYSQQSPGLIPLPHPQQPLYHTYPLYQYPVAGRNSVVGHESPSTPGFTTYENQNALLSNISQQQFVRAQEDPQRMWNSNSKSPKAVLSREHSHSGSSRATPLMNIQQLTIGGIPLEYPPIEQNLVNTIHYAPHPYGLHQYKLLQNEQMHVQHHSNTTSKNIAVEEGNTYAKHHKNENSKPYTAAGDKKSSSSNDKSSNKVEDGSCIKQVEKNIEIMQKIHSKSYEYPSNDKILDRRKTSKSFLGNLNRQDSFDQGTYKSTIDKVVPQVPPPSNVSDSQYTKTNSRFHKMSKASDNLNTISDVHLTQDNKFPQENSNITAYCTENCKDVSSISDIQQSQEITSSAVKEMTDVAKIKVEISKNIKESNIKSYLNFPKPRNFYKQNQHKNYERDEREPKRYHNKDLLANVQGHTSAWIFRGGPASPLNTKNSTTSTPSSAPASNTYTPTKTYEDKQSHNHSNAIKHYNKNNTKRDSSSKDTHPAPYTSNTTSKQDGLQQQPSNSTTTNSTYNKTMQRAQGTPPMINSYNQNSVAQSPPVGLDPNSVVRTQLIQTLGGVSLLQTPPQPGFYLRQIPGWVRRSPGPSLFGSPPLGPHIRAPRPPRPFSHHTPYRQR